MELYKSFINYFWYNILVLLKLTINRILEAWNISYLRNEFYHIFRYPQITFLMSSFKKTLPWTVLSTLFLPHQTSSICYPVQRRGT